MKQNVAFIEWMAFNMVFIILGFCNDFLMLPGLYTGIIIFSLTWTFSLVSAGYGIRFLIIFCKNLKKK